jgi:dienelactone hydrolase
LILVHGSGPSDRDEALGPNKPFRDIAWGVASRGVAVLRYNKRSYEHPMSAKAANFTLNAEAVDDAVSAAALLRGIPEINPQRIFVLGHSLGAVVAPRIGRAGPAIAGLILEGGVTRPVLGFAAGAGRPQPDSRRAGEHRGGKSRRKN